MAMSTGNAQGGGSKKSSVKVSQSTIDSIKKMGMTQALKLAGQNSSATQAGVTAEWAEGVRRMYGQKRYDAAAKSANSSSSTRKASSGPDAARAPYVNNPAAKKAAKTSAPTPKPTASQKATAQSRAGAGYKYVTPKAEAKKTKTPAQKAAEAALKKRQASASAAAVKRAGGRTM